MAIQLLVPQVLTAAAFQPFGQVLQVPADGLDGEWINGGTAQRFELVADAQLVADGGRSVLAIYRARANRLPLVLHRLQSHPLGSQSLVPLGAPRRFVLVVAPAGKAPGVADLQAFISNGRQGVLLAPGTWHHALLALDAGDFLVLERRGPQPDCTHCVLQPPVGLVAAG